MHAVGGQRARGAFYEDRDRDQVFRIVLVREEEGVPRWTRPGWRPVPYRMEPRWLGMPVRDARKRVRVFDYDTPRRRCGFRDV